MSNRIDQDRLVRLAEDMVAAARRAGADAADAVILQNRALSVSCRLGKVENVSRAEADDVGLRVFVGKRVAMVSANGADPTSFDGLAGRAVDMAKAAPEDAYAGLADPELLAAEFPDLDIFDTDQPDAEALERLALTAEEAGLAVGGVTNSDGGGAGWSVGGVVLVTSNGFSGGYLGSSYSVHCTMLAGKAGAMERDYDYAIATHFGGVRKAEAIGRTAGERAVKRLGARKIASGVMPVVFDPRVASSLIGHLAGAIGGPAIARGSSFLKDRLNEKLFGSEVSIVDDPLRPRGLRSRPFDGEGLKTGRSEIVKNGVLSTWLLDCASARELGLKPTGHARRALGAPPAPGTSNLHLAAGETGPEEMIGGISEGLYVTDLIGHGVNQVTGDYSRGAAGFRIVDGEIGEPVSEITIAGNLIDMFAGLVPASDLEFRYSTNAPTVLVERMTVAGR